MTYCTDPNCMMCADTTEYCSYHKCWYGCQCLWPFYFSDVEENREDLPSEDEVMPLSTRKDLSWEISDRKHGNHYNEGRKPRTFRDMR